MVQIEFDSLIHKKIKAYNTTDLCAISNLFFDFFPEMKVVYKKHTLYDEEELELPYLFYGGFFVECINLTLSDKIYVQLRTRIFKFLENLSNNKEKYIIDLVRAGIMEGLEDAGIIVEAYLYMGKESKVAAIDVCGKAKFTK